MAFKRKSSSAPSQSFYEQDRSKELKLSSGMSPVNSNGTTYDNSVKLNWPYNPASPDEAVSPRPNMAKPPLLDPNGRSTSGSNKVSPTLG